MSIKLSDLVIDVEKTLEGEMLVVEPPRIYENYVEGVKTGPAGISYICLCEGLNYEKQAIKVAGSIEAPFEYIGKPIRVRFEGVEGKVWQDFNNKGAIKLTVTATKIVPAEDRTRLKMNGGDKA